jgi:hypothetical protein
MYRNKIKALWLKVWYFFSCHFPVNESVEKKEEQNLKYGDEI